MASEPVEPAPRLGDEQAAGLAARAMAARQWAYAPYSNYRVGAALLSASGRVYDGVNVENAAYPSGICAERTAVFKAVSEGERQFTALAVSSGNGGMPCGACRQVLAEFGLDLEILIAGPEGGILKRTTLRALLPDSFGPAQLKASPPSLVDPPGHEGR
jgi:cytidine deaminase